MCNETLPERVLLYDRSNQHYMHMKPTPITVCILFVIGLSLVVLRLYHTYDATDTEKLCSRSATLVAGFWTGKLIMSLVSTKLETKHINTVITVNSFLLLTDFMGIERLLQFNQMHTVQSTCTPINLLNKNS